MLRDGELTLMKEAELQTVFDELKTGSIAVVIKFGATELLTELYDMHGYELRMMSLLCTGPLSNILPVQQRQRLCVCDARRFVRTAPELVCAGSCLWS